MTKVELFCISKHAPNEIVEVNHWMVEGLLASGQYELVNKPKEVKTKKYTKPKKALEEEKVEELVENLD